MDVLVADLVVDHGVFIRKKTPTHRTRESLDLEVKGLRMSLQGIRRAVLPLAPWNRTSILSHATLMFSRDIWLGATGPRGLRDSYLYRAPNHFYMGSGTVPR